MKIVVHGTNWIGDAVMTVPALRALRNVLPDAEITLYTRPWAESIFRDSGFLDRILSPKDGGKSVFRESRLWKKEGFDAAILLTNSFRTGLISYLAGVPKRFGYAGQWRKGLLTDSFEIPAWRNEKHEVFYYLELIAGVEKALLGSNTVSEAAPEFRIAVSDSRRDLAKQTLADAGIRNERMVVGLGVGSQNSSAKRWPAENFAGLNDLIQNKLGAEVVLLGSESEIDVAQKVSEMSAKPPINLAGKTKLDQAVAVLAELDMFVSNDMGLSHLASALGVKTLTIFGPTNFAATRPFEGGIIRREDVDCSPCMLRECPIDHRCMTRIIPSEVFERVKLELDGK